MWKLATTGINPELFYYFPIPSSSPEILAEVPLKTPPAEDVDLVCTTKRGLRSFAKLAE